MIVCEGLLFIKDYVNAIIKNKCLEPILSK